MLTFVIEIKLAITAMAGLVSAASPVALPTSSVAAMLQAQAAAPLEIVLVDGNRRNVSDKILIHRDGSTDKPTAKRLTAIFQCMRTHRRHAIAKRTLAMLADVAERYGKPIEYISAYRVRRGESSTSPHRAARAVDFRIAGVDLREVRDYLWRTYTHVGVGWYPYERFVHIDHRPTLADTAWTFDGKRHRYNPYWSEVARQPNRASRSSEARPKS